MGHAVEHLADGQWRAQARSRISQAYCTMPQRTPPLMPSLSLATLDKPRRKPAAAGTAAAVPPRRARRDAPRTASRRDPAATHAAPARERGSSRSGAPACALLEPGEGAPQPAQLGRAGRVTRAYKRGHGARLAHQAGRAYLEPHHPLAESDLAMAWLDGWVDAAHGLYAPPCPGAGAHAAAEVQADAQAVEGTRPRR